MLEQFHFLEPLWLLALIPLMLIVWFAFQANSDSKAWEKVIDSQLLSLLLQKGDKNSNLFPKFLLATAWIITVIALADPVWEKVSRPIFQTNSARVIVLDLSNSMLIDDLKPNRLARARFKIEDILSREEEGQTALVLFAGDAFTAAPLTRDTETIRSMLKVLNPQIMPAQGSRADLGLLKAHELLKQSGITSGQVLLIADGISRRSLGLTAAKRLREDGHSVSVMAVGTETGGLLNFRNRSSVNIKLEAQSLNEISEAGGGNYSLITTNNSDLNSLLSVFSDKDAINNKKEPDNNDLQNKEWKSTGPYLVLILLPFAALAFRKGWLLNIFAAFILFSLVMKPQDVIAAENPSPKTLENIFEVLSKNKAQRFDKALKNKQFKKALTLSNDPLSKGSAEYKLENYEDALKSFKQAEGADGRYNEANTLAKLEKYKEAITAYDEALKFNPKMQDALDNKKAIQKFLKKQERSKENQQSSNENQEKSDSEKNEEDQQNADSKQDQQSDSESAQNDEKKEDGKENQFSDANKDLDKNKEEPEDQKLDSAKDQNNDKKQDEAELAKQQQNEESLSSDAEKELNRIKEQAEELNQEEKMAAEQWLRRIPDDPGGLLKRKFRHQYNQNRRKAQSTEQPW